MYLKRSFMVAFAIISIMVIQSCSNDNQTLTATNSARVQLKLVDAPGDYKEVNVVIKDIQYNSSDNEAGWVSFGTPDDDPINVDLMTLIAGNNLLLADQLIPSGMLKQIRLVLGDGNMLTIEGMDGQMEMTPLNTPSAMQSGLKLNLNTTLDAGFTYSFILDWDVQKSIVMAGNSGMYNLKPVIRVSAEATSGSISGKVVEIIEAAEVGIDNIRVDFVDEDDDLNFGSATTNSSGEFLIQGLKAGSYILNIDNNTVLGSANLLYDASIPAKTGISIVGNGDVVDAGTITLTQITQTP